ncbi:MAG: hypothetical protein ACK2T5_12465, partial [Anaerolineales bacterium]
MSEWYTEFMEPEITPYREIKLNSKMLVVFVAILLFQQLVAPHKIWSILLIGMGGALAMGFFWARGLLYGVHFERDVRSHLAKVGDQLQERFVIANHSRFPALWVAVVDDSTFPNYHVSTARYVRGKSVRRWFKGSVCYTRGVYTLGPTTLETGDPFGLFSVRVQYQEVE